MTEYTRVILDVSKRTVVKTHSAKESFKYANKHQISILFETEKYNAMSAEELWQTIEDHFDRYAIIVSNRAL